MENVKEINVRVLSQSIGLDKRVVPMSMEYAVVTGNSLCNTIMEETGFLRDMDKKLNSEFNVDFEGYKPEYIETLRQEDLALKEVIKLSKVKMTIKIELEKYE